jgi:hypothetical protein
LKRLLISIVAAALLAPASAAALSPIRHVFIIVLENESAATTFGPNSPAPYLAKTLTAEGAYLPNYYGTGHASNDNYISMISGQAPNTFNKLDCPSFANFTTGAIGPYGQQEGIGCVYPPDIETVANQLTAAGLTWRDYNQSMGNTPTREAGECGHPGINMADGTESETAQDAYATRHDPFVYFHSIIDDTTLCDTHVVNLDLLPRDLASAADTPNYVFITPDLCGDGHDAVCADHARPGGFAGIEQFLKEWVPMITGSSAFREQDGVLLITFDEAEQADAGACCGEIPGPGSAHPGGVLSGAGGGDVGAVLLSPCIRPATVSRRPYNHYAMLRSVEDIFGLPHLGYAQLPGEQSFGSDVFNRPCEPPPVVRVRVRVRHGEIHLAWSATDALGPGVAGYQVQVRSGHRWRDLLRATRRRSATFHGRHGRRYQFRVRATDTSGIASGYVVSRRVTLK